MEADHCEAPAGGKVATLLGTTERPYLPGYAAIAAEHWGQAIYRLQLLWPAAHTDSFIGSCSVHGSIAFTPPATNTAQRLRYGYTGTGTCSGTLDGARINNAPVGWKDRGDAYGSCSQAQTTGPGQGTITFTNKRRSLGFTLDFISQVTEVNITFYGNRSGMAAGHATFATPRTSPEVIMQCAGSGARTTPLDLTLTRETVLVSAQERNG